MRRIPGILLATLSLVLITVAPNGPAAHAVPGTCSSGSTVFSVGDGSAGSPFIVTTPAQLVAISDGWYSSPLDWSCAGSSFIQGADIDMTEIDFRPIAPQAPEYSGTYDGNGYAITNLSINAPTSTAVGLFGITMDATITDLTVQGTVTGELEVGGVIGKMDGGTLSDITLDVDVSGGYAVGGAVGTALLLSVDAPSIQRVMSAGSVTGLSLGVRSGFPTPQVVGGIAGNVGGGTVGGTLAQAVVTQAVVTGDVLDTTSSGMYFGGVAGQALTTAIDGSQMSGNVIAPRSGRVGGLVGRLATSSSLSNSLVRGDVTGSTEVGGLVGQVNGVPGSEVENSLSTGVVAATPTPDIPLPVIGGSIGSRTGTSSEMGVVWNSEVNTPGTRAIGNVSPDPDAITAASTPQAKSITTYSSAGWSISQDWGAATTWGICSGTSFNDGYPYLRWRYTSDPCPPAPVPTPEPPAPPAPEPSPSATPTVSPTTSAAPAPTFAVAPAATVVEVAPGASTMLIGGVPAPVTRSPITPAGGFSMSGGGVLVDAVPPPTGFSSGGSSSVVMSGYAPDSSVGAFLFSDPVSLGTLPVGSDGSARGKIVIPANISPGQHTLQFTGWNASGEPVVLSAGITVKPQVKRVVQAVPFKQGSATLNAAGRAAVVRAVSSSAALAGSVRTTVSYVDAGTSSMAKHAKSRAQVVARALAVRGLRASITPVRSGAATRAGLRPSSVVITSTG